MQIRSANFITSLSRPSGFEGQGLPEVAMAGKSNVGKSSMINHLLGNKKLARTSSEPGKTRLINLYAVNSALILADLPGYGFARVPQAEKKRWAGMIEGYLSGSQHLKRVLQLVDIRHAPTQDDVTMVNYLRHYGLEFTVIATKADKLSRAERARSIPVICRTLAVQPWEVIPFSSEDGTGRDSVLALLDEVITQSEAIPAQEVGLPPL